MRSLYNICGLLVLLLFTGVQVQAQNKWELKKEAEGIRIYTKSVSNSNIKALKASFEMNGTPEQLATILLDINGQKNWVYSTKQSRIVKQINDHEVIYYSEKGMPWPVTNRDAVVHLKIDINPAGNAMIVKATSVDGIVPEKTGTVRVMSSKVFWKITPIGSERMKIEYEAEVDPAGTLPPLVVNMFSTKGPFETFRKLKALVSNPGYAMKN